jgi:class 3 adenylate cyclase
MTIRLELQLLRTALTSHLNAAPAQQTLRWTEARAAKDDANMALRPPEAASDGNYCNRRLVVVAVFDVVDFSRAVEADEDKALMAWRALRREIDPMLAQGGGRIFKSLGDGLLVEFSSPVEATRTALQVQAAVEAPKPPWHPARIALRHPHGRRRG